MGGMKCPICDFPVQNSRGLAAHFRHQSDTHPDYRKWREDQRWSEKEEGVDYVSCLECGHRAGSLALHLKSAHQMTAETYRAKHGEQAPIRPSKVIEKRSQAIRARKGGFGKGAKKEVTCPSCGSKWEGSKFLGEVHNLCCPSCKAQEEEAQWASLSEPEDYVSCLECNYRAESLVSHIQNAHPGYRARHPEALVISLRSAARDKSALKGKVLPKSVRQKMSENAGRWNKGLTKEDHPSLAQASEKMQGKKPWNTGLTAADEPRLADIARKISLHRKENPDHWDNGQSADLTWEDFLPFIDEEGRIDHRKLVAATGHTWATVLKYTRDHGLTHTRRYVEARAERQIIRLDRELLEKFKLKNGKVSIAKAMSATGHCFTVIKRECERHGLSTSHQRIRQTLCLEAIATALGGASYKQEWESRRFTNPPTGRCFRFDGFFPDHRLVVEFHGHQHYMFPNAYLWKEEHWPKYEAMRARDALKRARIKEAPDLTFFKVLEAEPFEDVLYLKGRLVEAGVLSPEGGSNKHTIAADK